MKWNTKRVFNRFWIVPFLWVSYGYADPPKIDMPKQPAEPVDVDAPAAPAEPISNTVADPKDKKWKEYDNRIVKIHARVNAAWTVMEIKETKDTGTVSFTIARGPGILVTFAVNRASMSGSSYEEWVSSPSLTQLYPSGYKSSQATLAGRKATLVKGTVADGRLEESYFSAHDSFINQVSFTAPKESWKESQQVFATLKEVSAGYLKIIGLLALATLAIARESSIPVSIFRQYFWGARQAYEDRDFKKAERLLRQYREEGSPSDKILKQAGCDTKWEVKVFSAALKDARSCLRSRPKSAFWSDPERAKFSIMMALRAGDATTLEPYVDCAPTDLVRQTTTCGTHFYRKPEDLERLAVTLKKSPEVLKWSNWRSFPTKKEDPQQIRWGLYSAADDWQPCGMKGTSIITLRESPAGEFRIAGFAVSCLEAPPELSPAELKQGTTENKNAGDEVNHKPGNVH